MGAENILKNGKPIIGIIAGSLNSFYQEGIVRGAADAAEEHGFNIITFAAGPIKNPDPKTTGRDFLFNIIDTELFDGFISPFSSHTRHLTEVEEREVLGKFSVKPVVNIGSVMDNCTNIITDYETGLDELIRHYIFDHGYKKIVLVRGPKNHGSSEQRTEVFRSSMKKYGMAVNEDYIIYADLRRTAAEPALKEIFDIRKLECDAIITMNDNLASAMLEELHLRGIRVPEDVALSGSMNSPLSSHTSPPLCSVIEPTYELGRAAMDILAQKLAGRSVPKITKVPTGLAKRDSCGCNKHFKHSFNEEEETNEVTQESIFKDIYTKSQEIMFNNNCGDCHSDFDWLFSEFKNAITNREFDRFISNMDAFAFRAVRSDSFSSWLAILSVFMHGIMKLLDRNRRDDEIYEFFKQFLIIKDDYEKNAATYQSFETDNYIIYFKDIVNNLNSSFSMKTVKSFATEILDITDIFISLYNPHTTNDEIINSTSLMVTRNGEFQDLSGKKYTYDVKSLVPQHVTPFNDRYNLVVMDLTYSKIQLGTLVMNLSKRKGSAFENIMVIISNALKNESRIAELKEAEQLQLQYKNHLQELVDERTKELQYSIENLKVTQKKLVEAEKMASMGELVAGVAHEINTPLGICLTSSSHMQQESHNILKKYKESGVTRTKLESFLAIMSESSDLNLSNINKVSKIINNFKQMAVDRSSEIKREFNLTEYIGTIFSNLYHDTIKDNFIINYNYSGNIIINSYPGVFTQIISYLISNAKKHGFIYDELGIIDVALKQDKNVVTLIFQNNGKAIPEEHIQKIFNPFFTTSRSKGDQGLGLNITYNLISQKLEGTIECESRLHGEKGTRFIIKLPND